MIAFCCGMIISNCYDVITWSHFLHYWPSVRVTHWWMRSFDISLLLSSTNCWTNSQVASDFRCHKTHVKTTMKHWQFLLVRLHFTTKHLLIYFTNWHVFNCFDIGSLSLCYILLYNYNIYIAQVVASHLNAEGNFCNSCTVANTLPGPLFTKQ